jgi:HEAT repeat protein
LATCDLARRMMLIQFMGLTGDGRCVLPILRAGLDEAVCDVAVAALEHMGEVTVAELCDSWVDLEIGLRVQACRALGLGQSQAATALLLSALDDVDCELRAAAARALGARRNVDALDALVRRLEAAAQGEDPDAEDEMAVLVESLVALASPDDDVELPQAAQVIDTLAGRLEGAAPKLRLAIALVLGRIGGSCDEALVAGLLKDPDARVRRAAVEALARLEPGAASEPLRLALADEAPEVRTAAAISLGQSSNPAVLDDLQRLIHDEDTRVSAAAVRAIGLHCARGNVAVERAIELVDHALVADGMVALAGVEALCSIAGPRAAVAATRLLCSDDPDLVQAAIACVGEHGDGEAAEELMLLISHPDWCVRAEAIQTLGDRRVGKAVPAILRQSESEQDDFVRDAIMRALRQLEG